MVGVAGELLGDGGVFVFSRHLQVIEDTELTSLGSNAEQLAVRLKTLGDKTTQTESTASIASAKANEAVTASGNALNLARGAHQEAESFEKDIVSAKKQAADAEAHLEDALLKAAKAQSEVLKLQEAAAWRDFSKAQADELISTIKPRLTRRPPFTVSIDCLVGNPEAKRYGDQLSKALAIALGLNIEEPIGLSGCTQCTGVVVFVNASSNEDLKGSAKNLADFLAGVGVKGTKFSIDPSNGMGANNIKIIVGPKE